MQFWRLYNNQLYNTGEVQMLGFDIKEGYRIPQEYLDKQEFVVWRTCYGIGDIGIISAIPRKLKEKYPNCKVYIPSSKLSQQLFGSLKTNWSSWDNPFNAHEIIFKQNPYVNGTIDSFEGDVFTDHYRIYDTDNPNIPLVEQILKFWGFTEDEIKNSSPEMYYTEEEFFLANSIIEEYTGGKPYFTLLLSNRFDFNNKEWLKKIQDHIETMPCFYWLAKRPKEIPLIFNPALDLHHVNIRIQLLIKEMAEYNLGNQTGIHDIVAPKATTYTIARGPLNENFIREQIYI